jgi:hypothetical protein
MASRRAPHAPCHPGALEATQSQAPGSLPSRMDLRLQEGATIDGTPAASGPPWAPLSTSGSPLATSAVPRLLPVSKA